MSRNLNCSKADLSTSYSVFDINSNVHGKDYIKCANNSLSFNLPQWEQRSGTCPAGYLQIPLNDGKQKCLLKDIPYPSFYKSEDQFKKLVINELKKEGKF